MGARKKEAARRERQGASTDGMANVKVKGENFYRYVVYSESGSIMSAYGTPQQC